MLGGFKRGRLAIGLGAGRRGRRRPERGSEGGGRGGGGGWTGGKVRRKVRGGTPHSKAPAWMASLAGLGGPGPRCEAAPAAQGKGHCVPCRPWRAVKVAEEALMEATPGLRAASVAPTERAKAVAARARAMGTARAATAAAAAIERSRGAVSAKMT